MIRRAWTSVSTPVAWRVWRQSVRGSMRKFQQALSSPLESQKLKLQQILAEADGSIWARTYGVTSETSLDAFCDRVPVQDPEHLARWVDRVCAGEKSVLTRSPVERLVPTSGTTRASKWIPMTETSRKEYALSVDLWVGNLMRAYPEMMNGPSYIATSPAMDPVPPPSVIPMGFASDRDYVSGCGRWAMTQILAVPPAVSALRAENWRKATRNCLWSARDLRMISLWHPGYLSALFDNDEISELSRRWSKLAVISSWADGACAPAADALKVCFPRVGFQPKGLWMTEGVISLPWQQASPVALLSGFLEFEADDGSIHLAHDLDEAGIYRPIITNHAGIYRYRTGDLVQVTGHVDRTPSLKWLGRADSVSDLCGEKLSEAQVAQAFDAAGWRSYGVMVPIVKEETRHYLCLVDGEGRLDLAAMEQSLRQNPHYAWARNIRQLLPLEMKRVALHPRERMTQIKPPSQHYHLKSGRLMTDAAAIRDVCQMASK